MISLAPCSNNEPHHSYSARSAIDFKIYMTQSATNEVTPYGINSVNALAVSDANVSNRKVCIVDSGYDINHDDLPKSSTGSSVTGSSYTTGDPWNQDSDGHGTHVAGTICALGGNGKGVVGVNRNGKLNLHIVRVFGGSSGGWIWSSGLVSAVSQTVAFVFHSFIMSLNVVLPFPRCMFKCDMKWSTVY